MHKGAGSHQDPGALPRTRVAKAQHHHFAPHAVRAPRSERGFLGAQPHFGSFFLERRRRFSDFNSKARLTRSPGRFSQAAAVAIACIARPALQAGAVTPQPRRAFAGAGAAAGRGGRGGSGHDGDGGPRVRGRRRCRGERREPGGAQAAA